MVLSEAEGKLIKELREAGVMYEDIGEIYKQKSLDSKEVNIMLKWLPEIYLQHVGSADHLVRSLISASNPYDPSVLISLFEKSTLNRSLKWGIAHVLSHSKTTDISEWMTSQLFSKEVTFERAGLVQGMLVKKYLGSEEEEEIFLKRIFDRYPIEALDFFKKRGTKHDIDFLLEKLLTVEPTLKKEIKRVIHHIQKKKQKKSIKK